MKRHRYVIRALLMRVAVAAAASFPVNTMFAQERESSIVGLVLPLRGVLPPYEKPNLEAMNLAIDQVNAAGGINGRKIELVVEDTQASNATAINALNKVLQSKPIAAIGPGLGTQVLALQPLTEKAKLRLIAGSTTSGVTKTGARCYFRNSGNDELDKKDVASFIINNLKKSKLGIIHVIAGWAYQGREYLTKELKGPGNNPQVVVSAYQPTDKGTTARIKSVNAPGA
ncbi:ABC transporter substrate-binding protein [Bradyrhizobium sp. CCBAU 21359]|uniref:ABC transporter substrate-binding protein n=1 Tax=Bradyrhizobium sp. CCBAU 21359 TaxID=1325080 RepID=UPI0023064F6C|nr:ABC transporter substrate-binding protein [Bradyrhizobium sp. CCBAU 21359]